MSSGGLLAERLTPVTLVVGKGGVGKTTVAAALATHLAHQGLRTLVVTTDPAGTLLTAFDRPIDRTVQPVPLVPQTRAGSAARGAPDVWALDTGAIRDALLAEWREPITQILDRGTYLDLEDVNGLVDATLPGGDEIFAVLALGEVLARTGADAYERVIIDTAPTGHTLRLLSLPESFAALVRLFDAMHEKHRFMVRALTHRYRPDRADALIAELRRRVDGLRETLTDPARTSAVLVVRPEPVVIAESVRYVDALRASHVAVAAVVVNVWNGSRSNRDAIAPLQNAVGSIDVLTVPPVDAPVAALIGRLEPLDGGAAATKATRPASGRARTGTGSPIDAASLVKSITVVGGKGGVGKTTVACALAIAIADAGHETLLVSTDPAPSVGDALDLAVGDEEARVPGCAHLVARQMDATGAFAAFRDRYQRRIDDVFEGLTGHGLDASHDRGILRDLLALAPPGIDELYALTVLGETLEERRFTHIVVDPAPTGHLLRLLDMPALAIAWSHQLMRMMLKYKEVVGLGDAAQDLLSFAKRTRALDERLHDAARATSVLVTLDEPLVRGETDRLRAALGDRRLPLTAILWNRAGGDTTPLPASGSLLQLFAPHASPAPVGLEPIREWTTRWGTIDR